MNREKQAQPTSRQQQLLSERKACSGLLGSRACLLHKPERIMRRGVERARLHAPALGNSILLIHHTSHKCS